MATNVYLMGVENGDWPLLTNQQRLDFTEQMALTAILQVNDELHVECNVTVKYQKRIVQFFSSQRNVQKLWEKFELQQALVDGRLSPERIVANMLGDIDLSYGQKSTLESYAVIAITEAKGKRYNLARTLRFVHRFVQARPVFREIQERSRMVQS